MKSSEKAFRKAETILDALFREAEKGLASQGIYIIDQSVRSYCHKYDRLVWMKLVRMKRSFDHEFGMVSLSLFYGEKIASDNSEELEVLIRAEVFQLGSESRVDRNERRVYDTKSVEALGFHELVHECLERGWVLLK